MKSITRFVFLITVLFFSFQSIAQSTSNSDKKESVLKTYLIERDIPGAGSITPADLKGISQKSCSVIKEIGPSIQWMHSYVTGNKVFCVYKAENEAVLKEHAKKSGFPITSITQINNIISPATAEQ